MSEGITPSLDELVALRRAVSGRRPPRHGRHGMSGQAPSPMRGRGMEYAESREYAIGDDARHIDWRLTARTGKPHTKLFQAERERLTLIVADTAPTLYFGTRVRFKSVQAARAGALAAWAAVRDGDRIAALRGTSAEAPVVPVAGPRGALRVLDAMVRWYARAPAQDDGLAVALDHADRLARPGTRLVVLADPLSAAGITQTRWSALAQHREVVVLLLSDPLEREPPMSRLPFLVERLAASGVTLMRRVELDLGGDALRRRWRDAFVAPLQQAQDTLARSGIRAHVLSTDASSDAWLGLLAGARGA
ncbi:MAG: DUF58 domain-containing protein [Lysobacter sp.]|nr:DUF58 domain-containing protein [Lysobacter sp.]